MRLIDERAKINVELNYSISWKRKLNGNYLCLAPEDFTVVIVMSGVIDRLKWLLSLPELAVRGKNGASGPVTCISCYWLL